MVNQLNLIHRRNLGNFRATNVRVPSHVIIRVHVSPTTDMKPKFLCEEVVTNVRTSAAFSQKLGGEIGRL